MTYRSSHFVSASRFCARVDTDARIPELPSLHPMFSIPTEPNGQNHTRAFTAAAAAPEAHAAALAVMKGLAMAGFRVLDDAEFADRVQRAWKEDMGARK